MVSQMSNTYCGSNNKEKHGPVLSTVAQEIKQLQLGPVKQSMCFVVHCFLRPPIPNRPKWLKLDLPLCVDVGVDRPSRPATSELRFEGPEPAFPNPLLGTSGSTLSLPWWSVAAAADKAPISEGCLYPALDASDSNCPCDVLWCRFDFSWTFLNLSNSSTHLIELSSRVFKRFPVGRSKPPAATGLLFRVVISCGLLLLDSWIYTGHSRTRTLQQPNVAHTVKPIFQRSERRTLRKKHKNAVQAFIQMRVFVGF